MAMAMAMAMVMVMAMAMEVCGTELAKCSQLRLGLYWNRGIVGDVLTIET